MELTEREFRMGMAVLTMNGLPKAEEAQMKVWFRLLSPKLKTGELEPAVMRMCETVTFYPNTNVVALVLAEVKVQREEKRSKAWKEKQDRIEAEGKRKMALLEAEYKKDPEKFVSLRKVQQLASRIGRDM